MYAAVCIDNFEKATEIARILMDKGASRHALGDSNRDSAAHVAAARYVEAIRENNVGREKQGADTRLSLVKELCDQPEMDNKKQKSELDVHSYECQVCAQAPFVACCAHMHVEDYWSTHISRRMQRV